MDDINVIKVDVRYSYNGSSVVVNPVKSVGMTATSVLTGPKGDKGDKGDPGTTDYNELQNLPDLPDLTLKADKADTYTKSEVDTKDLSVANTAQSNLTAHTSNTSNPHSVTKAQVGLGNVDNTSDANKPVSTAQQTALDGKVDKTGDVMTGSLTATTITAGTATDVLGTALSVIRNNVAVGRIDNNASGLRVQAQNGSLQLRGTGNAGITVDASGNAVVAGTITATNLSGTNTGDNLIIGTSAPTPAVGEKVLWLDTTGGNITLNLVTGD